MIDLKLLRSNPELFEESYRRRGLEIDVAALVSIDVEHRQLTARVEDGRAEQNRANKRISEVTGDERTSAIEEARRISDAFKGAEEDLKKLKDQLDAALAQAPNLVHPKTPEGADKDYAVIKEVGDRVLITGARDHVSIGEQHGVIDVERAAKVSGSRFGYLRGKGALLEIALVRFALDRTMALGYIPIIPPVLVREEAMFGTGFFPTDEHEIYKTANDDLFLVGTSEVPLASMHSGETLIDLPLRYAAFSSCFRREAGTYGKDTKGIIRLHQFEKVEMFIFCEPSESDDLHLELLSVEEEIFQALEIPYRVVEIAAGELGAAAYRKFDIEAWLPGAERWLEVTSCSNCTDYQSRRLGIRTKSASGSDLAHTLNGTAIAVQRTIVSLLENHQNSDRTVQIPEALKSYTGFDSIGEE